MAENTWKTIKLSDITEYINRGVPPVYTENNGGTAVINQRCIREGALDYENSRMTDETVRKIPSEKILQGYDILINSTGTGTVGRVAQIINLQKRSTVDSHVTIVRPNKDVVDPEYLGFWMKTKQKELESLASGSTNQIELSRAKISEIKVVLPPTEIQKKLVKILSSTDDAIEKTDQIIQRTEKLKNGFVYRLLSEYEVSKYAMKDIAEITSSKRVMVSDYVDNGVPFYRSTEIIKKSKNIPLDNVLHISLEKFNFFKERFGSPKNGDILVTAVGTIGNIYLVQNEMFYFKDGNLLWIRNIKKNVLPEYLKVLLSSRLYFEKLNTIAGGSSQKAITIEKMGMIRVAVPSVVEQKKIVDVLHTLDMKIDNEKETKKKLLIEKNGIMQQIFE